MEIDPEVQLALELSNMCQLTGSLPRQGGLLDQDGYLIFLIQHALVVKDEKAVYDKQRAEAEAEAKRRAGQ